ncbi:hypothetical protein HDU91_006936 [Kappamyces sp. JEL0680]|nr:hypothetical protein HDU91_006936 [Kappamyces sp. JEL0680]
MGYVERAVGLFQALIELNCFAPSKMGWRERVGLFEDFWESERPRFGDKGAKGWQAPQTEEPEPSVPLPDDPSIEAIADPWRRWHAKEERMCHQQWLPVRNSIQDDIDDPFQTVMYSDIDPFLFPIVSTEGKKLLVDVFLMFLGFGSGLVLSSSSLFYRDPFLHTELENSFIRTLFVERKHTDIPMSFPLHFFPMGVHALFGDTKHWPSTLGETDMALLERSQKDLLAFVVRVLEQSSGQISSHSLYTLWIQSLSNPTQAERTAKKILKTQPMNLTLWNVYGQIVLRLKGQDEARKIYSTILSMYQSFPEPHQVGIGSIFGMLAEMEWKAGKPDRAISVLHSYSVKAPVSTMPSAEQIKAARIRLNEAIDDELLTARSAPAFETKHSTSMEGVLALLRNAAMLGYLDSQDPQAVVEVYAKATAPTQDGEASLLCEMAYQDQVHLLVTIMQTPTSLFRPALLRQVLEEALERYPSNTLLLGIYGWSEGKYKVEGRIKRFLGLHAIKESSHIIFLFSLWTELHQTSEPNYTRLLSLARNAVEHQPTNPSLWIMLLTLSIQANEAVGRTKSIYWEAINACPYSKQLYLFPFSFKSLLGAFATTEWDEILSIIQDKEIRLCIPPFDIEA